MTKKRRAVSDLQLEADSGTRFLPWALAVMVFLAALSLAGALALGGSIEVPGLDGSRHEIKIPAGIQSGKQIRQRGAGMPVLNGRGQGDLVIQVDVETPTKLTAKQKELLEAFRETETGEECPASTGFFGKLKELWGD